MNFENRLSYWHKFTATFFYETQCIVSLSRPRKKNRQRITKAYFGDFSDYRD